MTLLAAALDIKKELAAMIRERRISSEIGNLFLIFISLLWRRLKALVSTLAQYTKKKLGVFLPPPI
jgi:hypothetical protein